MTERMQRIIVGPVCCGKEGTIMPKLLEAGRIVNTHGIRGEVKIDPWCDTPRFLCDFDVFYIDGAPVRVLQARPHGTCVLAKLEGITDIDQAMHLRGRIISIDRDLVQLPEGQYFIADLLGLAVYDDRTGEQIGTLTEVLPQPASDVYVVQGARKYLIPAVPAFIAAVDLDNRAMRVHMMEGLATDEN